MPHSAELHERSPLRLLDRSIHGGLGAGNLGVVCAGAGAGKSAFLVAVALDHLLRRLPVLHVALDHPVERVRDYYDEIFADLALAERLDDAAQARAAIDHNRRIHAYPAADFAVEKLARTLELFRGQAAPAPDLIVVDGWDWQRGSEAELRAFKALAASERAELWMSAPIDHGAVSEHPAGYPVPVDRFDAVIDVLLRLKGADGTVHVKLLKEHGRPVHEDVALDLDPTTLLLKKVEAA